jgi:hypothetical protein
MAMTKFRVKVDGVERSHITVESLKVSYGEPRQLVLVNKAVAPDVETLLTNYNVITCSADDWVTLCFSGHVTNNQNNGYGADTSTYTCLDMRERYSSLVHKWIGHVHFRYNEDVATLVQPDSTCPLYWTTNDYDGTGIPKWWWTIGEIIIDVLEHACGVTKGVDTEGNPPTGFSLIPDHHPAAPAGAYLTDAEIMSWDGWLLLTDARFRDQQIGEIEFTSTFLTDILSELLEMAGNFGWYLDPDDMALHIVDLDATATVTVTAGVSGHCIDESGAGYELIDNPMGFNLSECITTAYIQGYPKRMEVRPDTDDIRGYRAFHLDELGTHTVAHYPGTTVAWDKDDAWQFVYDTNNDDRQWYLRRFRGPVGQRVWDRSLVSVASMSVVALEWLPGDLDFRVAGAIQEARYNEGWFKLIRWPSYTDHLRHIDNMHAWYVYIDQEFEYQYGPTGSAYSNYGYVGEISEYCPEIIWENTYRVRVLSSTGYANAVNAGWLAPARQETDMLEQRANYLMRGRGDEIVNGTITTDGVDLAKWLPPGKRLRFANLGKWSTLDCPITEVTFFPNEDRTELTINNQKPMDQANSLATLARKAKERRIVAFWRQQQALYRQKNWNIVATLLDWTEA